MQELEDEGRAFEAKRLYERTTYDLEMIRELGYCSGIENYSRYFDGRQPGERPFWPSSTTSRMTSSSSSTRAT